MKLIVVECEWELGLNGDDFEQRNLGFYPNMEVAMKAVKEAYEGLFDPEQDPLDVMIEDGLITFHEGEI